MASLSALFSSLSPRRIPLNMVPAFSRKLFSKQETPSASPPPPPFQSNLNSSPPPPQPALRPSPPPPSTSPPQAPPEAEDDFVGFSDSDDDSDSDSDEERRTRPKFDYDARFRPLQNLDLDKVQNPGPTAELCYILEDFGSENLKSWCLPDFVPSNLFATVKGGETVDFITEFNEFFWLVWVHRTGKAGVIPAFNVEGGLEKEARINKEKMEKHSSSNPPRKRVPKVAAPTPPIEDTLPELFVEDEVNKGPRAHRSVGFKSATPQKVFRYVAPDYISAGKESDDPTSWVDGWVEVFCPDDESIGDSDAWRPGRGLGTNGTKIGRHGFRRFRA